MFRSYLFAPGNNEKLLTKVFDAGADAVVLDLEDAVAPEMKTLARRMVADTLKSLQRAIEKGVVTRHPAVYVRINAVSTGWWRDDLRAVTMAPLRGIRLAKAESVAEIHAVIDALADAEDCAGLPIGSMTIAPTIETAVGLLAAAEIARMPRVECLSFGAADFVRDLNLEPDEHETQTLYARSHLALVSRVAGIKPPVASVYTRIKDLDGLRASAIAARRLGFYGRSCIHPSQIPIIHEVFTPDEKALAEARAIVEAWEKNRATGIAAFMMENGQFVDAPIVERARAIIRMAG